MRPIRYGETHHPPVIDFFFKFKAHNEIRTRDLRVVIQLDVSQTKVLYIQWLKWFCEAGGSPDEARLERTPYPYHIQLIWRYLGIK